MRYFSLILIIPLLVILSGCGRVILITDSIKFPQREEIPQTKLKINIVNTNDFAILQWKQERTVGEYHILRAYAFPNKENSFKIVAKTSENAYQIINPKSLGIHYYKIEYLKEQTLIRSNYVTYSPYE